ncbi:hypothetical protein T439DRAFT_384352 [Meredithblackwellia eburnea MCA 4105]
MPVGLENAYFGEEQLVITLDVGNTFSSVSIAHLEFGQIPTIRTVTRYPGGHASSRTPSSIAYDLKERPRAYGAETLEASVVSRAKTEGWVVVTGFKAQMKPAPSDGEVTQSAKSRKLSKKPKPERSATNLTIPSSPSTLSLNSLSQSTTSSGYPLLSRSLIPDQLIDAYGEYLDGDWVVPPISSNGKKMARYEGPVLKLIYADHIKHLVACARAWFAETTPQGEDVFVRLWPTCTFIIPHPADWGSAETDVLRDAMQLARLVPAEPLFQPHRLVFLKETAAIVYFARAHAGVAGQNWATSQQPFVLCDTAEVGTSVIGYKVVALSPLLKLQPYDPLSKLPVGARTVTQAFQTFITKKLSKSKFRNAENVTVAVQEFERLIKPKFGSHEENFEIRLLGDATDLGANIVNGFLTLKGVDIEDVFQPTIAAILARVSAVASLGEAKAIVVAGGFGESPYLQRRLRETFEPRGISIIIPEIPTHNAVSEGAARFYLTHTIQPRQLQVDFGVSSAVDWSSNWEKGMDRPIFTSVDGKRFILGKWTAVAGKNSRISSDTVFRKTYNMKYVLDSGEEPNFKLELWTHDPASEPETNGWMTNLEGKPYPNFTSIGEVAADLRTLVEEAMHKGTSNSKAKKWVQLDVQLLLYVGAESLQACVAWTEKGVERRGPPLSIKNASFF